ncbi:LytR/AlgR family response regulator transcription factor [Bacteroidota bacterium]
MNLKCLVVDDEQLARKLLSEYIDKVPFLDLIGECKNPLEAVGYLETEEIDLLFLDIQMPEITGIEFLKTMKHKPVVILTTAYSEYALEGYELDVTDYLVKPFSLERFLSAANKARDLIELKRKAEAGKVSYEDDYIMVHADHKIYRLKLNDIQYIEGLKEYISYFTANKRIIALESLKKLEEKLPSDKFLRIHKSYIVPIDKIKSVEGNQVEIGDKMIPIGRSYKDVVMKVLFQLNK